MLDALYVGATGMRGQQLQIDTIAHNLANMNTIGFRRGVTSFSEVSAAAEAALAATLADSSTLSMRVPRGAGVLGSVSLSGAAGELKQTNEPLDVAIDGTGFLEVIRSDGTPAYTRAGKLKVDEDGMLSTAEGWVLAAQIEVPAETTQLIIATDGRVSARVSEESDPVELGNIELVTFANASAMQSAGANLYVAPAATGEPQSSAPGEGGVGQLRQGFVESSNVQLSDELVTLMLAQRGFELNARVVQAADQMLSITNSLYR
jgi:flagellar basal-body rod protein FlgG